MDMESQEFSSLNIKIDNYSGPLEVLLDLAKAQKVNLEEISITQLADQFNEFINKTKKINLDIASEYLLMATWLTYLKSKLLLPEDDDDDFIEVCVEIEHSYLGDLDMSLTSPGGTEVMLFEQVGGGTWLGDALDMDATETPGACWEYCWSVDADFGTFANSLTNTMIAPLGGNSMIPGSYEPLGDFSDYEGSPANGTWVLTITDNLAIDNGFICAWGHLIIKDMCRLGSLLWRFKFEYSSDYRLSLHHNRKRR